LFEGFLCFIIFGPKNIAMLKWMDRWKLRLFMFAKLPAAFFAGVRLRHLSDERAEVSIRYHWFSRNPFRSIYFACLAMAGEFATGILGFRQIQQSGKAVSMLVVRVEGEFFKKAIGKIMFICKDGQVIKETINQALSSGEGVSIRTESVGYNSDNEEVAKFYITWSFKKKS